MFASFTGLGLAHMTCFGQWNQGGSESGSSKLKPKEVRGILQSQSVWEKSRGRGELEPFNKAMYEVLDLSPSCVYRTLTQNNTLKAFRTA